MFVKLVVLSCFVAVALSAWNGPLAGGLPAAQYPAGVSPHACPNFPHCTNPALSANPNAPAPVVQYAAPTYNQEAYNAKAGYNNALHSGVYTGDGDYHGEGLAEAGAFGDISHSFNSEVTSKPSPALYNPVAYGQPAPAPAGIDTNSCPNYPYCH